MAQRKISKGTLPFYQKLLLNQYVLAQLGASREQLGEQVELFQWLAEDLRRPELEAVDREGHTGFYDVLKDKVAVSGLITQEELAQYDLNIVQALSKINARREVAISLKYFQYLALLFTELYLSRYFQDSEALLHDLNDFVYRFNERFPHDAMEPYQKNDLNKLAFWNATGSGKTLLMHINYYQYLHYMQKYGNRQERGDSHFLLITPSEGLSSQHLLDFERSGIYARRFEKDSGSFLSSGIIQVLEVTKLDTKDGDKTVSINRFGHHNVVFVDEGHRGSSGDTWKKNRDSLCSEGFSFEYSATFGQAVEASNKLALQQEYAKCIISDYSYRHFYADGYGKDYNILNLADDSDDYKRQEYLTACLITYYQQKRLFLDRGETFQQFHVENPLMVFVGASVNAVSTKNKKNVSDVVDILLFIKSFVDHPEEMEKIISHILSGNTGLQDEMGRDIFRNAFLYVQQMQWSSSEIYRDILEKVFNCSQPGAELHVENLKGADGEIRLRLGADEKSPFGVINVGDETKLLKLLEEKKFLTRSVDFGESLFHRITDEDSTINMLIGSKKFTEGWNCWRVSTMGFLNVGKSEGSEIIQLFGRGVRLKGYEMSLKRSSFYVQEHPAVKQPEDIEILETLNIFGVHSDYMADFQNMLRGEGIPDETERPQIFKMPVIKNRQFRKAQLYKLQIKGNMEYKNDGPKLFLQAEEGIHIDLDCYGKVQFERSEGVRRSQDIAEKKTASLGKAQLAFLDEDRLYFAMQEFKNQKGWYNVNISRGGIRQMLENPSWYTLYIDPQELKIHDFVRDYRRMEDIAETLLKTYLEKLYTAKRKQWESPRMELALLSEADENFVDEYKITVNHPSSSQGIIIYLRQLIQRIHEAKKNQNMIAIDEIQGPLRIIGYNEPLYNPLLSLEKGCESIKISPVALEDSEYQFLHDLKQYLSAHQEEQSVYLIRNKSRRGIGFFETEGFYPDFILWIIKEGHQYITFVDPHGMMHEKYDSPKVLLYQRIKNIEAGLHQPNVILNSFILSPTPLKDLVQGRTEEEWNERHVLFMGDSNYMKTMFSFLKSDSYH